MTTSNVHTPVEVHSAPPAAPTLVDLFQYYDAEYLADKSPVTRHNHQILFRQVLREIGPLPLAHVTPEVFRTWKVQLSARCQPSTIHKYLVQLSTVFRAAVDEYGWVGENPLKRVRKPSPGRGVVRCLSDAERRALLAACQASAQVLLYPIVLLALSTGGRKNESRTLCWSEVDVSAGLVRFLRTKNSLSRAVPLTGDACRLLQRLATRRDPGVAWVFPSPGGERPVGIDWAWRQARWQAGVTRFRFHDLRHTFASYLAMSGASLRDIAELLGHKIFSTRCAMRICSRPTPLASSPAWRSSFSRTGRRVLDPPAAPCDARARRRTTSSPARALRHGLWCCVHRRHEPWCSRQARRQTHGRGRTWRERRHVVQRQAGQERPTTSRRCEEYRDTLPAGRAGGHPPGSGRSRAAPCRYLHASPQGVVILAILHLGVMMIIIPRKGGGNVGTC